MKDKMFKKSIRNRQLSKDTIHAYSVACKVFYKATGKTITEAYNIIKDEQKHQIKDGYLLMYNPNEGSIRDYFEELQEYLVENGRSKSTQNNYQKRMRSVFSHLELELPKPIKIKEEKKKLTVLNKKDISFVMSISNIFYKSLYCFQSCTGIRISDTLNFTINDWLDATFDYHKCTTVQELLEKDCDGEWFGYWEFKPQKTLNSSGITCQVYNTPESNKLIIETLKQRQKRILSQNKRKGLNCKIEGTDPLFPSNKHYFKTPLTREAVVQENIYKNQRLQKKLKKELKKQYKNGLLSQKEYEKKLENLPKFHTHALRHFFITTTRAFLKNRDIGLIMEAHVSDITTDQNYIGQTDGVFDKKMIKEHYIDIVDKLTFSYTIDPEEYEKLKENENKYKEQLIINQKLSNKIDNIDDTIKMMEEILNKKSVLDVLDLD